MSLVKLVQVSFGAIILCGVTYAQTPNGSTIVGTAGVDYSQTNTSVDKGLPSAPPPQPMAPNPNIQVIDGVIHLANPGGVPNYQSGQPSPVQVNPQPAPASQLQIQMPASVSPTPTTPAIRLPAGPIGIQ